MTPAAVNFPTGTAGVVDTGGKFAASVNSTGGKLNSGHIQFKIRKSANACCNVV
jgi:hypothetical protein